jgi:hypothetical protein
MIGSCAPNFEPAITPTEIGEHIFYLASDELQGRYPGSPGDSLLAHYITKQYRKAGLLLHEETGLQPFMVITDIEIGQDNRAGYLDTLLVPGADFNPLSFSANGSVQASLVFAGFGFQVDRDDLKWNDFQEVDVKGKWVMILRSVPGGQEESSPFVNFSEDRGKALLAADLGAAGVILVSGAQAGHGDELEELKGKQYPLAIPAIQMTRRAADGILSAAGADSLDRLEERITSDGKPVSFETGIEVSIVVDLKPKNAATNNTIAMLKGSDPSLRDEYVWIGAHHDHLGMGGPGTSSRDWDTVAVHYGADDNASGVAGVIEISEYLISKSPSRSVVFTTFGAEEMGLVGSKFLTEHSPFELSQVQAMINLDMIGRLNSERQLQVGGVGTSPIFESLIDSLNREYGFSLKFSSEGYGPTDHASFYAMDVPVLFLSTGAHPEYHTPADRPETINLEGAAEVMAFAAEIALALSNEKEKIAFLEAGPKVKGSSRGRRGGITLGLMPDVTYEGTEGMPVMFVTEGKPAAVGGIQKGDLIVAIEGKSVGNVYDYMNRLDQLKEGMDIVVTVNRAGSKLELVVRL